MPDVCSSNTLPCKQNRKILLCKHEMSQLKRTHAAETEAEEAEDAGHQVSQAPDDDIHQLLKEIILCSVCVTYFGITCNHGFCVIRDK